MNRYLSIPLVLTLAVFSSAWFSQRSSGDRLLTTTLTSKGRDRAREPLRELLPAEEVEAMILKDWPTLSPRELFSRRVPTMMYHARLIAEPQRQPSTHFLWDLEVTVFSEEHHYPIHVDRESGTAHVFADNQWLPYDAWRINAQAGGLIPGVENVETEVFVPGNVPGSGVDT